VPKLKITVRVYRGDLHTYHQSIIHNSGSDGELRGIPRYEPNCRLSEAFAVKTAEMPGIPDEMLPFRICQSHRRSVGTVSIDHEFLHPAGHTFAGC
jgi:hypothetical protein